jgi:hypothetical protein
MDKDAIVLMSTGERFSVLNVILSFLNMLKMYNINVEFVTPPFIMEVWTIIL